MRFDVLQRDLNVFSPHFLEASAGTGKTFAIEHLVTRLLLEGSCPLSLEQILVMTFTRAATRELKLRIRRNLWKTQHELQRRSPKSDYLAAICERGDAAIAVALKQIEAALVCFDSAQIFTLHGFCYRALKEGALEAGVAMEVSDPDHTDPHLVFESFVRTYLRDQIQMPRYSPMQMRLVLKKHKRNAGRMVSYLVKKMSGGQEIEAFSAYDVLLAQFIQQLCALPPVQSARWEEDVRRVCAQYKGLTGDQFPKQFALWGKILEERACSAEQFDQLIKEKSFLVLVGAENLKARAQPTEGLHYPGLVATLRKYLLPCIEEAGSAFKIILRLARDLQQACALEIEEKEKFFPDALLGKVEEALKKPAFLQKLQKKYRAVIVDEFQDTDPVQWKIVQELFLPSVESLCLVGDPKQSIYAFRSADVYTYLSAAQKLGPEAKKHLDTNFRSTPELVRGLNLLFSQAEKGWMPLPALQTMLSIPPVRPGRKEDGKASSSAKAAVHFFLAKGVQGRERHFPPVLMEEKKLFPYVASEIQRLFTEDAVALHEIALLVQDRFQAKRLIEHLKLRGIPAQFKRSASLVESAAFFSFKEILHAILLPHDLSALKAALGSALLAWSEEKLLGCGEDFLLLHAKAKMLHLHRILAEKGFACFFQSLLQTAFDPARGSLLEEILLQGEISLYSDFRKLAEWMMQEEQQSGLKGEQFLAFLEEMEFDFHEEDPRLRAPAQEEKGSVSVMTIHHSKGLEFHTVFALGIIGRRKVRDEAMVRRGNASVMTLYNPEDPECRRAVEEQDAEKMRQLYVALTRAKERLYIPYPIDEEMRPVSHGESSPLELLFAYIGQKPEEALKAMAPLVSYELVPEVEELTPLFAPPSVVHLHPPSALILPESERKMYSFSSLAKKEGHGAGRVLPASAPAEMLLPHHLPLGAETGLILHSLFEKIFQAGVHSAGREGDLEVLIQQEIALTPLQKWQPLFFPWIQELLRSEIAGFSLSDIHSALLQQEMEFYFPLKKGVMKGFADLIFEQGGKYYLLDWKSNYLGPADADYTEENILLAMHENDYFLQARIYKEALARYVKLFDKRPFEQAFGGAIYYFVRGKVPYFFIPGPFEEEPC